MTDHKILYFEGAGVWDCDSSHANAKAGVPNLRIRTAFHDNNGRSIYLELTSYIPIAVRDREKRKGHRSQREIEDNPNLYVTNVDFCHYDFDCNGDRPDYTRTPFHYTHADILHFINSLPDVHFDDFMVVSYLAGYHVHRESRKPCPYNYGDEFVFDEVLYGKRLGVQSYIYGIEKSEGQEYPNFSLWPDENDPNKLHLLRHFIGYNKHWEFDCNVAPSDVISTMKETRLGKYGC